MCITSFRCGRWVTGTDVHILTINWNNTTTKNLNFNLTKCVHSSKLKLIIFSIQLPSFRLRLFDPSESGSHCILELLLELECFTYAVGRNESEIIENDSTIQKLNIEKIIKRILTRSWKPFVALSVPFFFTIFSMSFLGQTSANEKKKM